MSYASYVVRDQLVDLEETPMMRKRWPIQSQIDSRAVDQRVRRAVVTSLKTLYTRAGVKDDGRLQLLLRRMEQGPVRPAVFGIYTDLVESFLATNARQVKILSDELLDLDPEANRVRVVTLLDEHLGQGQSARYARLIDDDPERRYAMRPLGQNLPETLSKISSALELLDEEVPEVAEDIRALVREIVLVTEPEENRAAPVRSFEGASTFYLWGAIFINVGNATRLDLAQTLAHESAHLFLFGMMGGQPLTSNDPSQLYASPLRQDPRPIEGVVHAAYVLARMSYVCERLLESGALGIEEQEKAGSDLANHRRLFFDTLPMIERHATFRPGGEEAFRDAIEYMRRESQATG